MSKILFVHHGSFVGGGSSVSLINTLKWIKENKNTKFEIKLWCPYKAVNDYIRETIGIHTFQMPNTLKTIGKVLIGWAPWYRLKTLRLFLRELMRLPSNILTQLQYLHQEKPDIIHLNSSILFSTAIAAKVLGIPIVWHVREVNLGSRYSLRRWIAGRLICRLSTCVIAISPVEADRLGCGESETIKVVYNYIDFREFELTAFNTSEIRSKIGIDKHARVIITLGGSASFRKGIVQILLAMKYTNSRAVLMIVGPCHHEVEMSMVRKIYYDITHCIEDLFYHIGLTDSLNRYYDYRVCKTLAKVKKTVDPKRIISIGEVSTVAQYIAASDLLIFGGMTPHFPRPIYEAWAMKKPVVAFDVDGIRQNINNDNDGVLINKRRVRELGKIINDLFKTPDKCRDMGESGYRKADKVFRIEKNMEKIIETYQAILCGSKNES